jgi:hypothetical protein
VLAARSGRITVSRNTTRAPRRQPAHSGFEETDSTDLDLPHLCRLGKIFQGVVADKAGIHAADGI